MQMIEFLGNSRKKTHTKSNKKPKENQTILPEKWETMQKRKTANVFDVSICECDNMLNDCRSHYNLRSNFSYLNVNRVFYMSNTNNSAHTINKKHNLYHSIISAVFLFNNKTKNLKVLKHKIRTRTCSFHYKIQTSKMKSRTIKWISLLLFIFIFLHNKIFSKTYTRQMFFFSSLN